MLAIWNRYDKLLHTKKLKMCLGIPMKVAKKEDRFAWVKTGRLMRQVNIEMVPRVKLGDYVIVHAGFAIEVIDQEAARHTLSLLDQMP
ncbi:MAG: HypC/HybG/HupF family hydrogenase formation chaperone [Candidatus Omnitrophota bacterium]